MNLSRLAALHGFSASTTAPKADWLHLYLLSRLCFDSISEKSQTFFFKPVARCSSSVNRKVFRLFVLWLELGITRGVTWFRRGSGSLSGDVGSAHSLQSASQSDRLQLWTYIQIAAA